MRRLLFGALAGMLLAMTSASTAMAGKVLLYPEKVDVHFADANGKVHTLGLTVHVEKSVVGKCMDLGETMARSAASQRKPELHVMAYLGTTCRGAPAPRNVSAKMPVDERPAMVVLMYSDDAGAYHYSSFGRKKAGEYEMGTCPLVLSKSLSKLRKQVEADHAGQKFLGADCFLLSANRTKFTNR
jgi:hypothetical protein